MRLPFFALALLLVAPVLAAEVPASPPLAQAAPPGACPSLPRPRAGPAPFPPGESLTYDVDVLGAKAGRMTFEVLSPTAHNVELPIRVRAESNTFFTKIRKVKAEVTSYLRLGSLRPSHFHEELAEGPFSRVADVSFGADKVAVIDWRSNTGDGSTRHTFANDALDYVGGIFLFRGIPLKVGEPFCFDAYAIKRMWRVEGKVEAREHVSVPAGEFDAFHLSGMATSYVGDLKREVHIWVSDDARRLPLAAVGVIDLGPVRATLVDVHRPDLRTSAVKGSLEW